MNNAKLLGSYWTLAVGAYPWTDREYCPEDFRTRVELAARAGFTGLGLHQSDLAHLLKTHTFQEMHSILQDNGIDYIELEFLLDWYESGPKREESDKVRALLLDAAEHLDAGHIKIADIGNKTVELPEMIEHFKVLCAQARERDTNVLFEILPGEFSMLGSLDESLALTRGANEPNGGLLLDIWHMVRMGITNEELREKLTKDDLIGAEINDGFLAMPEDLHDATVNGRLLVGEGEFDVKSFIETLDDLGYDGPIGVEVLSAELRDQPLAPVIEKVYQTTYQAMPESRL